MIEPINLDKKSFFYEGNKICSVPDTYKAFLELCRDKLGLTNDEFNKSLIIIEKDPITCKKDYIKAIKKNKDKEKIDIKINKSTFKGNSNYLEYLQLKEPEKKIKIYEDEEIINIKSNVNEFYATTQVTQYYMNYNDKPVELSISYPLKKEIIFKKFTIKINDKKACSKILDKEKATEKYTDAMAEGNVGIYSKYSEKEKPNSYSINIGNIEPYALVELTSEFIQFITSDDMSYCFTVMTKYPNFSDGITRNVYKKIKGKIILETHSKITRLLHLNFEKNNKNEIKNTFNKDYTSCDISFKISRESDEYNRYPYYKNNNNNNNYKNKVLSILFRTEKMNEPYLLSQYNPEKDETSYIFSTIYDQKPILPLNENEIPDCDININYYNKYQSDVKTETPSLFIFLIDQSGSMSGKPIQLVSESLLFFLQSLPKDSYFQLIGFGSKYVKINDNPVLYNKENVEYSIKQIKELKADLGGTNIYSPLKYIFKNEEYNSINLGRNLFILTDGEVEKRKKCLDLISKNCEQFKIHAIGIGGDFDKKFIEKSSILGKGSHHFVQNISDINSVIIQSLSKCLRNYLLNVKLSLEKIEPEYEFTPRNNFIYPDEILNYYFILKGKNDENKQNIQINRESNNNNKNNNYNYIFSPEKIIKENDGELFGQIIIGNILKNTENNNLDENLEIKLSKNYQILSKKTSLFAMVEGEMPYKMGELIQVQQIKEKNKDIMKIIIVGLV